MPSSVSQKSALERVVQRVVWFAVILGANSTTCMVLLSDQSRNTTSDQRSSAMSWPRALSKAESASGAHSRTQRWSDPFAAEACDCGGCPGTHEKLLMRVHDNDLLHHTGSSIASPRKG